MILETLGLRPKNSDIVIQEQTFARAVEANGASCMSLPVNLELVGGFADIFDLVRRIETLPRLVVIREMDLS
ncbi:MAG TPA: type 4a pilus biogenesis protein PilO, partial [Bacteroidia bacterium]|nr:type 4a pilus biogenesis protein PilO [Bacteroidia bacterium]